MFRAPAKPTAWSADNETVAILEFGGAQYEIFYDRMNTVVLREDTAPSDQLEVVD